MIRTTTVCFVPMVTISTTMCAWFRISISVLFMWLTSTCVWAVSRDMPFKTMFVLNSVPFHFVSTMTHKATVWFVKMGTSKYRTHVPTKLSLIVLFTLLIPIFAIAVHLIISWLEMCAYLWMSCTAVHMIRLVIVWSAVPVFTPIMVFALFKQFQTALLSK